MSNIKKLMMSAAGGAGLNVEDVFSTYLHTATGSNRTITNGIDLAGEGGMAWFKKRSTSSNHGIFDTERGATNFLRAPSTNAESTASDTLTAFNSDGFSLGADTNWDIVNGTFGPAPQTYVSWTFRKAPKFFDIVTYTGDGVAGRQIPHNLGQQAGFVVIKSTSTSQSWIAWHRTMADNTYLILNGTSGVSSGSGFFQTADDTMFQIGNFFAVNENGATYVAYLFAHNDGDGDFGPDGDADIIKCGSYAGNGSSDGPEIDLGFEPQWLMVKSSTRSGTEWKIVDSMRGIAHDLDDAELAANSSDAEVSNTDVIDLLPNGFKVKSTGDNFNTSGNDYIYIAIRRGTKVPESGDEVFAVNNGTTPLPTFRSNFAVDLAIQKSVGGNDSTFGTRLLGPTRLKGNSSDAELSQQYNTFDYNNGYFGYYDSIFASGTYSWMWKRAPGFLDVVAYDGNSTNRTITHNLGKAPDMIWVKCRSNGFRWQVYSSTLGPSYRLLLDGTNGAENHNDNWNLTAPTDTEFSLGTQSDVNWVNGTYIAYLFATLAGISKVGSYTGNGSSQTIDCGFTSGARFILIKRTDSTGDWYVWDTARGIVAGDDPYLVFNTQGLEVTSTDWVDPDSSGFIVNGTTINASSADYIFYAIA